MFLFFMANISCAQLSFSTNSRNLPLYITVTDSQLDHRGWALNAKQHKNIRSKTSYNFFLCWSLEFSILSSFYGSFSCWFNYSNSFSNNYALNYYFHFHETLESKSPNSSDNASRCCDFVCYIGIYIFLTSICSSLKRLA